MYQLLINGREKLGTKKLKNPNTFIKHLQACDDVYENLENFNPTNERKVLIAFDDMIAGMESNKNF